MIHAYAINSLRGCDYYIKKCTCGYENKIRKMDLDANIRVSSQEFCPKCGTPLMSRNMNVLTLASTQQKGSILNIKTYNKACYFELEFYNIDFQMKVDFQKKSIKVDKRTLKNDMFKMVFDASQKQEDFIKYYNKDNIEINEEDFLEGILSNYYNSNKEDRLTKFSLIERYFSHQMSRSEMKVIINRLKEHKDFFIKYEQIIKSNIDPYYIKELVDLSKTNPIDMLGIRPFTFKYIRNLKTNIPYSTFTAIKLMESEIGDQTVNYLQTFGQYEKFLHPDNMRTILELVKDADLSVTKLYKYVYKDVPMKQFITSPMEIITLLRDSFEMSQNLGLVFNKNSKTLKRYHDELVEEYKTIEDKMIAERFKKQMRTREYLQYEMKDSEYCIVVPKESQELVKEGKELKHCVGSYIKRVSKGDSFIVFLRKKETPKESYTTIEINKYNEIVQIRKKHNASLIESDAIKFVRNWVEEKNLKCSVL